MYKQCISEQSAARQREMELGLLQQMAFHRYEDITVNDLCDSLGVPRKTFYRYFSNKDGALYALIDHTLMEFAGNFLPSHMTTQQSILNVMERYFTFWSKQKALLATLTRNDLAGILVQRSILLATAEDNFSKQIAPASPKRVKEYAIMFRATGLTSLIIQWYQNGFLESPLQMAEIATRLLTHPLATEPLMR